MTPLNEQQLDQLRDERKEQIKKAALRVFARRGISGTKMSMIAVEAGISQGLSYRYFRSKEELYMELIEEAMVEAMAAIKYINELEGSPTELMRTLTGFMLDADNKYYFMLVQQARTSDDVPEQVEQVLEKYSPKVFVTQLLPTIIKGQQEGEFVAGNPEELLFWYFAIISGLMLQVQEEEGYGLPDAQFLMRILKKQP